MKIILDNGHGQDTAGKRSPDGRLKEYLYAREIARRVKDALAAKGLDAVLLVPEENDVPLSERVARANKIYQANSKQAFLVSIHCNAAGNGSNWMAARGWSVYIDPTASQNSKRLAIAIANAAEDAGLRVRKEIPNRAYWVDSLYICKKTNCPAVLTENLFQDNRDDMDFLLSEEGKQTITDLHVNGIINYIKTVEK